MAADLKEALHFPHHIARNDQTLWYGPTQSRASSLWSWLYHGRRTWKKPSRERNSGTRIYAWNAKTKDGRVKWCPSRLVVVASSVETTTSYLTRLGLTNRARRRATQQLQTAAERASSWIWSKVRKSTTAWQNRPPSSLLPYPHPTPPQPQPSPTLSLPLPTTSIPIPSSAYRASRSTCSPQWHHPVAEAAGGARVWGTTGSRRNHLTRSGRWLTRVMSRQLLLHVVCIYSHCVIPSLAQFPLFQLCKHAVFARILMILLSYYSCHGDYSSSSGSHGWKCSRRSQQVAGLFCDQHLDHVVPVNLSRPLSFMNVMDGTPAYPIIEPVPCPVPEYTPALDWQFLTGPHYWWAT